MSAETIAASISLAALPALGQPLEDGTFAGILTQRDGQHVAIVLLPARAEGVAWRAAMDWAAQQGGQLPTRPMAALLFANAKSQLKPRWHWSCEEYEDEDDHEDVSYAWSCGFVSGRQNDSRKSFEGCAVAVRSIPLNA